MKSKKYTYLLTIIISIVCIVSFFSFDQKQDLEVASIENQIPPLVQKELDIKIKKYQQIILDKCRKKALEEAEFYIDSLVAEVINFQASDTLKFPAQPTRPDLREPIILNDSTSISPIIK